MRLIQILGDNIEELYNIPDNLEEELIKTAFISYMDDYNCEIEGFDDYWNNMNPNHQIERVYVEEIII